MGVTILGGMGRVVFNKDTIDEWVDSYRVGITKMFNQGRK